MLFALIFARVHLTFPLNEMHGFSRLCDRLQSSVIIWKQLSLRSYAICDPRSLAIVCDHMETSLYPLHVTVALIVKITPKFSRHTIDVGMLQTKNRFERLRNVGKWHNFTLKKNPSCYTIL